LVGRLQRVPLREVWKHEALDFTTWLQDNHDVLNDVLDISLSNVEREQAAGSFSVDLVGEDESGDLVVIENQLDKSDHDHLGKLITYLTAFDAKTAIWIVGQPRPEHVTAISWLNESTAASFYLIKVEAIRISDSDSAQSSPPAPLLTLIVGPSETSKEVGVMKKEWAEREITRHRFWTELLEKAKMRTPLHANISPGRESWAGAGGGKSGLEFNYNIHQHSARVEFYIDSRDSEWNKMTFDFFYSAKEEIEEVFGAQLDWQRLDSKRASRICTILEIGGLHDDDKWAEIQEAMIDAMIRLEKAVRPYIQRLP
jgi:hypothetical protein